MEAKQKANELYNLMCKVSEIRVWFLNNSGTLTNEQREDFVKIWNLEEKLTKKSFDFLNSLKNKGC